MEQLKTIRNGEKVRSTFSAGEMNRRLAALRAHMAERRDNYFVAVKSLIPDGSRVGIEFDHISLENFRKLQGALPTAEMVDTSRPTMRMRMVKSGEEIAWIRESARIAGIGGAACVEAISVGVPEYEVALHATQAMVREIGAGGYREHDILMVTEAGAEDITGFPYGPDHNIVRT